MSKTFSNKPFYGFDPKRDISPVDPVGFVNLHEAFVNHSLPGTLEANAEDYNGVEDPASLIGKSADVFDAYRKAQYVQQASSAAAKAEAVAASSSATE